MSEPTARERAQTFEEWWKVEGEQWAYSDAAIDEIARQAWDRATEAAYPAGANAVRSRLAEAQRARDAANKVVEAAQLWEIEHRDGGGVVTECFPNTCKSSKILRDALARAGDAKEQD
jgi:hypothetical protein